MYINEVTLLHSLSALFVLVIPTFRYRQDYYSFLRR